jgi:osmotically-inducible protein OsmY
VNTRSDAEIQQDVLRELSWDPRVKETDVGVAVKHGVVTLSGTLATYPERLAAQEAAHRVIGVLDVANDVVVKPPGGAHRTDAEIAAAARRALAWDVVVPHERVRTTVADGWVALEGEVGSLHEREAAERAVRHLSGVRGVGNRIVVRAPAVDPERVRAVIREALERRAERTAERIGVRVADGEVTLEGKVRSWPEREAVLGAARYTGGVREVHDHLVISPS